MIANTLFAAGAFVSLVAAVPMAQPPFAKRDIVWETNTEIAYTTVPVTVTHWLEPGETPPVAAADAGKHHYGHMGHGHGHGNGGQPPAQPETTQAPPPPAPTAEAPAPSSYEQPAPPPAASTNPAPAPEPTTEAPAPPAYTPQPAPQPQPSPDPAPSAPSAPSGGSSSGLSGMGAPGTSYTGDLTYYAPGLGACGITSTSSEPIVAISEAIFDSYDNGNPNNNPLCNKKVTIIGEDGSGYTATIVDRCPGCAESDLDLSPEFFKKVVPNGDGRVSGVKWSFD